MTLIKTQFYPEGICDKMILYNAISYAYTNDLQIFFISLLALNLLTPWHYNIRIK